MAEEKAVGGGFAGKISNFWFYHKWHLLAGILAAAVLAVCFAQCAGNESADYTVGLYLNRTVTGDETAALEAVLSRYGEDVNGDGRVTVNVYDFSYKQSETYYQTGETQQTRLNTELSAGEIMLYITDDYRLGEFERNSLVSEDNFTVSESGGLYTALEGGSRSDGLTFFVRSTDGFMIMDKSGSQERLEAARRLLTALEDANTK